MGVLDGLHNDVQNSPTQVENVNTQQIESTATNPTGSEAITVTASLQGSPSGGENFSNTLIFNSVPTSPPINPIPTPISILSQGQSSIVSSFITNNISSGTMVSGSSTSLGISSSITSQGVETSIPTLGTSLGIGGQSSTSSVFSPEPTDPSVTTTSSSTSTQAPSNSDASSSQLKHINIALIVGPSVGLLAVLGIIASLLIWRHRKRNARRIEFDPDAIFGTTSNDPFSKLPVRVDSPTSTMSGRPSHQARLSDRSFYTADLNSQDTVPMAQSCPAVHTAQTQYGVMQSKGYPNSRAGIDRGYGHSYPEAVHPTSANSPAKYFGPSRPSWSPYSSDPRSLRGYTSPSTLNHPQYDSQSPNPGPSSSLSQHPIHGPRARARGSVRQSTSFWSEGPSSLAFSEM
ncbi:hypothetical protein K439DRAFT_1663626 [Ramaria rubella]|nr:hypothetical protein K439DRAFT_1663626 [Ramaria rubella]